MSILCENLLMQHSLLYLHIFPLLSCDLNFYFIFANIRPFFSDLCLSIVCTAFISFISLFKGYSCKKTFYYSHFTICLVCITRPDIIYLTFGFFSTFYKTMCYHSYFYAFFPRFGFPFFPLFIKNNFSVALFLVAIVLTFVFPRHLKPHFLHFRLINFFYSQNEPKWIYGWTLTWERKLFRVWLNYLWIFSQKWVIYRWW